MSQIDDYLDLEKINWHFYELKVVESVCPSKIKDQIDFLKSRLSFDYGFDLYKENPFIPMIELKDGRRSVDITDLTDDDKRQIESIIKNLQHPILLGKLYDILGLLTKEPDYKELAADKFFEYAQKNCNTENYITALSAFRRCLYLLVVIKNSTKLKEYVNRIFTDTTFDGIDLEIEIKAEIAKFLSIYKRDLVKDIKDALIVLTKKESDKFGGVQLEIIKVLIDYYKSIKSSNDLDIWQNKFADICEELSKKNSATGYKYLQQAVEVLDKNNHAERINNLRFLIDEAQKKFYEGMNFKEYEIDSSFISAIEEKCQELREKIKSFENGARQFLFMLIQFEPVQYKYIKSALETQKKALYRQITNQVLFDDDGRIIFESSSANEEQKLEHDISEIYQMYVPMQHAVILRPFIDNVEIDVELKTTIKEILANNLFVPEDRREIVYDIIENGLNRNIRKALYDLIPQFENGCREYLKKYKNLYPVINKGAMSVKIDLNHIFVQRGEKENPFREAIREILGDDLTLQIEYLSCRSLSANIRNRFYHYGYADTDKYTVYEMVLFFLIIKAYCLGCD